MSDEAAEFVGRRVDPLPRFRTMGPLHRSFLLLSAGLPESRRCVGRRLVG